MYLIQKWFQTQKRPSTGSYINIVYSRKYNLSINNNGAFCAFIVYARCQVRQLRRFFSLLIFLTHSLSHIKPTIEIIINKSTLKQQ